MNFQIWFVDDDKFVVVTLQHKHLLQIYSVISLNARLNLINQSVKKSYRCNFYF